MSRYPRPAPFLLALLGLFAGAPAGAASEDPVARIEKIVVGGEARLEADVSEAQVVRAPSGGERVAAQAALALFEDDLVITSPDVRVIVLFAGDAAEGEKRAIVDGGSEVRISSKSSLALILGRVLANVRGFFQIERPEGTLGALGTEFEVRADKGESAHLLVLEGTVSVSTKGSAVSPEKGPGFHIAVEPGGVSALAAKLVLRNRCANPHIYELRAPEELPWVSFLGERVEVPGQGSRATELRVKADASRIQAGTYAEPALVKCLDCDDEPGCGPVTDHVPLTVTVRAAVEEELKVPRLEEVTLGDAQGPRRTTEPRVRAALDWTNPAILAGRPDFVRGRAAPTYADAEERARGFREARYRSTWLRARGSSEALGRVYTDWGEGAKAVEALEREIQVDPSRERAPDFLAGLGEAYRLKGRLDDAEKRARLALQLDPKEPEALNTLGNVFLDRAGVARDQADEARARDLLEQSRELFAEAAKSSSRRTEVAAARANVGEVSLALGHIARQDPGAKRLEEAARHFQAAEQAFRGAEETDPRYPFSGTGLGEAYRGSGNVWRGRGDTGRAREYFQRSEDQYGRVASEHPELAAAQAGLGTLYVDLGRTEQAVASYTRALKLRPADPGTYYRLGLLLARDQPAKAAEYMQSYLDLETPAFKQGARARQAQALIERSPLPGPSPTPSSTPTPRPPLSGKPVKVPKVLGDDRDDAVKELTKKGLSPEVREQASCEREGRVLAQDPRQDSQVPPQTPVTITVASKGPSPVRVPKVEGLRQESAAEVLERSGLAAGRIRTMQTSSRPEGTVMDQDPEAGQTLAPGCRVEMTVAIPEPLVEVPTFIGLTEQAALQRLPGGIVGAFSPLRRGTVHGQGSGGRVVDQNPKAGERVSRGTEVELFIGEGGGGHDEPVDTVEMPDLNGWRLSAAVERLKGLGLNPQLGQKYRSAQGCVVAQKPEAGRHVPRGSGVVLQVGACPPG